jgi:hypothetical protein
MRTDTSPAAADSTATSSRAGARRFVDPEDLICPGCGERVRCAPPAFWPVCDGVPVAQFSHLDRTALCHTAAGMVAEPVEVSR